MAYLHTHMMPAPNNHGVIAVNDTGVTADTTIAWQEGTKVYELQRPGDPIQAIQTVVNVKNNLAASSPSASNNITTQTNSSDAKAAEVITQLEQGFGQVHASGPLVDLGTGIEAAFSGGAGQYRYQWHEGNWTIDMLGFGDSSAGTQVAKDVVAYLHTHMLPAPKNKGVIIMTSSAAGSSWRTQVTWQEGSKVHQIADSGAPVSVLETVVNSNSQAQTNSQWKIVGKMYEVQGIIAAVNGKSLVLSVRKNILGPDSSDTNPNFPFKVGSEITIRFDQALSPKAGDHVVLDVSQYATGGNPFWGVQVNNYYIRQNGGYYNQSGQKL